MESRFKQRYGSWAVVTGASDGIGRAMAFEGARLGLNIVLVARRRSRLDDIAQEIAQRHAVQTRVIDADLSDPAGVHTVVSAAADLQVGLLIASAGFGTSGRLIDSDIDTEVNMLHVNSRAVVMLAHHFGKRFAAQKRGGIVLMSSLVAFQGVPMSAHYAATKAYNQSLAEGLHIELVPCGVDVIASAPGPVESGFSERANLRMNLSAKPQEVAVETLKALGRKSTVRPGRLAQMLELGLATLPRYWRVRAMARIMGDMTRHQQHSVRTT